MVKAKWYKGNIHTHSTESDGDEEPAKIVSWYRRHGYDFLVLSDHNHLTLLEYSEGQRRFKKPLMIPGEELSAVGQNRGRSVPIHINGIGISRVIEPIETGHVVSTIQANVNAILDAGGIASINHPNFHWAFDHHEICQVNGASLIEVFNGHPWVNNGGGPGKFSTEQIWDGILSSGKLIFAAATDDAHHYHDFHPSMSNPGRGWIAVRTSEFSIEAIVDAISEGSFYASTGVVLEEVCTSPEMVSFQIKQEQDFTYQTTFIGCNGSELTTTDSLEPRYKPRGDESYVRAVIRCSARGEMAWVQPVFLSS